MPAQQIVAVRSQHGRMVLGVRSQFRCAAKRSTRRAGRRLGEFALTPKMPDSESRSPFRLSLSKHGAEPCIYVIAKFRCRSVAAAGDLLFFASPMKPKEKKGDPGSCVPPLCYGQPAVLSPAGVSCKLGYRLKQARALFRLAFRSSAHTEGGGVRIRIRIR